MPGVNSDQRTIKILLYFLERAQTENIDQNKYDPRGSGFFSHYISSGYELKMDEKLRISVFDFNDDDDDDNNDNENKSISVFVKFSSELCVTNDERTDGPDDLPPPGFKCAVSNKAKHYYKINVF